MENIVELIKKLNNDNDFEIRMSNASVSINSPYFSEMVISINTSNSKETYGNYIMVYNKNINEDYLMKVIIYLVERYENNELDLIQKDGYSIENNSDITEDFEDYIKE